MLTDEIFCPSRFKEEVAKALEQYEEKEDTLIKEVRFPRNLVASSCAITDMISDLFFFVCFL